MDVLEKAKILAEAGHYDSCGPQVCEVKMDSGLGGIYTAKAEHKDCRIFKTLMNNSCSFDCKYCGNSSGCNKKKAAYKPEEVVTLFNHLRKKLDVKGFFLSSGVGKDPDQSTEEMLKAVRLLRYKHKFRGYVHFKVLPGTSYELVKQASELSSRMSINIEAPNKGVLDELSSCKDYKKDILKRQSWISKFKISGGQSTQMILNNLSTDKDIIKMADWEYNELNLRRVYYSAFKPVKGTPLEKEKAERPTRQNHLYNVDFLMRSYDFKVKEFNSIMDEGMLPNEDPKLAMAKANFDGALDINEASYDELIRIPGIGPKTAKLILGEDRVVGSFKTRRKVKGNGERMRIRKYEDLHKLGGWVKRAKPFIEVEGKRQTSLIEF